VAILVSGLPLVAGPLEREHAPALGAVYAEHGPRIRRFLRDLLGDPALAADATQETFVRAHKKLAVAALDGPLVPWLFGIARNVSLEMRKSRARGRWLAVTDVLPERPCPRSGPEEEYLGREAARIVGAALEQLSEERRAMLLMRLDHQLAYEDIAAAMGCSLAKVKVEIFRAREVLRKTMAEYR
jgi:RNA polymerase sigma-70 factor (ECF subfamily)